MTTTTLPLIPKAMGNLPIAKESIQTKVRKKKWKRTLLALCLLVPSLLFMGAFTIYPIVSSIKLSLYQDNLAVKQPVFLGLKNYTNLQYDPVFLESFWNNLLIAVATIVASIAIAVIMAVFATKVKHGRSFVRVAYFYPTVIPLVAAANLWMFIYTPIYGLLGQINPDLRLLSDSSTAIWALIVVLIWKQAGYLMVFYISGLNGISQDMFEAAKIDGAGSLRMFRYITWPLLKPTTIYVTIIALTNAYKMVDHLYIMTKGGPGNSTNMLLYYIYQTGFDFWNQGKASAMTVIMVGLLLLVTSIHFFLQDKKAYYN